MRLEDIRRRRKKLELTQKKLSELSGISQSAIAKIEAGKMNPSYGKAKKIFDALDRHENKESVTAEDLLTKEVVTIESSGKVKEAVSLMKKHDISQLPVFEKDHLVGLISENLLTEKIGEGKLGQKKVKEVMSDAPPTVASDAPLKFIKDVLNYVPIILVYSGKELSGVITKSDLLGVVR